MSDTERDVIRVVLADDHPIILDGLVRWFEQLEGFEVLATASSLEALRGVLSSRAPDVIVIDFRMPGVEGVASLDQLAREGWCVVVFSSLDDPDALRALASSRVCGFVSKSSPMSALADAIQRVRGGEQVLPELGPLQAPPHTALSERERLVFEQIILGRTPKEIAYELDLAVSSVYTYSRRVRRKLGVEGTRELVQYAYDMGLLGAEQRD